MTKIFFIALLVLVPGIARASTASDFTVNPQSAYDVPYGIERVLILDLTLPEPASGGTNQIASISLHNAGTVDHTTISKLEIWQDGKSPGWDGDETEAVIILQAPFFDTAISGSFQAYSQTDSERRIFVTVDLKSGSVNEKSFKIQLLENSVVFKDAAVNGPTDAAVTGLERIVRNGAATPTFPATPIAQNGQALSASAIRWSFIDLSDNEFGFKILDANLKEVARVEQSNIAYLDETGLSPDTEYSGRRIVAFNDRGESLGSTSSVFPAVRTAAETKATTTKEVVTVAPAASTTEAEVKEEIVLEKTLLEKIQDKIIEIQQQINNLLQQLNELLQKQAATIWQALSGFLRAFLGK